MAKTKMVSFDVTKYEEKIIHAIAQRAVGLAYNHGIPYPIMDAEMDITAVHCNGNPLRLDELLSADEFNFAHDILGILRHIDRTTGELLHCFSPRYSQPERASA